MPEHDFLYSLREDLPDDFKIQLKEKLDLQMNETEPTIAKYRTWWTVGVASIVTLMLSLILITNASNSLSFTTPLITQPSLASHGLITNENINQLQPITTLGGGYAYDFEIYEESVFISTMQGIYEHSAENLNADSRLLVEGATYDIAVDGKGNIFYQQFNENDEVVLYRWDRQSQQIRQIQIIESSTIIAPNSLFASENGEMVYIATCVLDLPTDVAYINCGWQLEGYNVDTGDLVTTHQFMSSIAKIAQSGDRQWLVYYSYDLPQTNLYLNRINMNTTETITLSKTPYNPDYQQWITHSTRLAISHDGQKLLTGHPSFSTVKIWDVNELLERSEPLDIFEQSSALSFSIRESTDTIFDPTGNFLIQTGEWMWRIYDISDDVMVSAFRISTQHFESVDFSDDGELAFGIYRGILYVYDTEVWEQRDILTRYVDAGHSLSFTADSMTLLTNQVPAIFNLTSDISNIGLIDHQLNRVHILRHAVISPDGQYVAYQPYDTSPMSYGKVFIKNLETDTPYQVGKLVTRMAYMGFLPDNSLEIVSEAGVIYHIKPDQFELEQDTPYDIIAIEDVNLETSSHHRTNIKFSQDGNLAALWDCESYHIVNLNRQECETMTLHLWDVAEKQKIIELDDSVFEKSGYIDFSPDGKQLVFSVCTNLDVINEYRSNCTESEVRIYHVEQLRIGQNLEPFATFRTNSVTTLTFHPQVQADGSYILTMTVLGEGGMTQFWQISSTGETVHIFSSSNLTTPIHFSPNGKLLVTESLEVWGVPFGS